MQDQKITPPNATLAGAVNLNGYVINFNKKLGKHQCQTKPTSQQIQDENKPWNLQDFAFSDVNDFAKFMDEGYTIYSGCFRKDAKSLTIDDVEGTQIVFLDVDNGDLHKFLDKNVKFIDSYGVVVQPSISSEYPIPNKFHVFLFLDEIVTNDEDYKKIWDWCTDNIDFEGCYLDKSKNAFNNLIFFSDKRCIVDFNNPLDSKSIIEQQNLLLEQVEKNNKIEEIEDVNADLDAKINATLKRKKEGITGLVLQYLYQKVYVEKCGEDIEKLYCLHNHNFKMRRVSGKESSLGITEKWDGSNPFSETNQSGTSLCVSQFGEQLPLFYDRSNGYNEKTVLDGKYRNGGTFISYWWECGKLGLLKDLGIKKKPYSGSLQDKGKFSSVLKDITKFFGVENFDFRKQSKALAVEQLAQKKVVEKKLEELKAAESDNPDSEPSEEQKKLADQMQQLTPPEEDDEEKDYLETSGYKFEEIMKDLNDYLVGKIYHCQWDDNLYLYFSRSSKTWQYTNKISHIVSHVIQPLVKEIYKDQRLTRSNLLIEKLTKRVENACSVEYGKLDHPPEQDVNKTPFLNGVYDIKTGKLYDYDDPHLDGFINYRVVPRNYFDVPDDDPVIQQFNDHFTNWLKSEEKGKCLRAWTILNIQRQAYRTGKIVAVIGQSGAGKSTYGSYLVALFGNDTGNFAIKPSSNSLTSNNGDHNTSVLEGRNVFVLEEFIGDSREHNTSIEQIKSYTGEEGERGVILTVNPKHQQLRSIRLKAAFTCSRQGMIQTKDDDQGVTRRFVIVTLEKKSITPQNKESWKNLFTEENLDKIFNWGLKQDTNQALEDFKNYSGCKEIRDNAMQNRKDNNPVYQWMEAQVHITNDPKDVILSSDFCNAYGLWAKNNRQPQYGAQKFIPKVKAILNDSDYFKEEDLTNVDFKLKRVKGHKNAKRAVIGIRILDVDDVVIAQSIEQENEVGTQLELQPKPGSFESMVKNS